MKFISLVRQFIRWISLARAFPRSVRFNASWRSSHLWPSVARRPRLIFIKVELNGRPTRKRQIRRWKREKEKKEIRRGVIVSGFNSTRSRTRRRGLGIYDATLSLSPFRSWMQVCELWRDDRDRCQAYQKREGRGGRTNGFWESRLDHYQRQLRWYLNTDPRFPSTSNPLNFTRHLRVFGA